MLMLRLEGLTVFHLKKALRSLSVQTDIPFSYSFGEFKLELFGDHSLLIGCHRGLSVYEAERIVVAVEGASIAVNGANLTLEMMNHQLLKLSGTIRSIQLVP